MMGRFVSIWSKFDPDATGIIEMQFFGDFMFELEAPLGWEQDLKGHPERQQRRKTMVFG